MALETVHPDVAVRSIAFTPPRRRIYAAWGAAAGETGSVVSMLAALVAAGDAPRPAGRHLQVAAAGDAG